MKTHPAVDMVARAIYKTHDDDGWTWETDVQANRDIDTGYAKAALLAFLKTPEMVQVKHALRSSSGILKALAALDELTACLEAQRKMGEK